MKNRVRVFGFALQHLDRVDGGQNKQLDFVPLGFALYSLHDGQSTVCTTADDELVALPGNFLFYRERHVAELFSKFLRRLFLALADLAAINDSFGILAGQEVFSRARDQRMDYLAGLADA